MARDLRGLVRPVSQGVLLVIHSLWIDVDAQVSSYKRAGNAKRSILRGLLALFTGIFHLLPSVLPLATHKEREKFHQFKIEVVCGRIHYETAPSF